MYICIGGVVALWRSGVVFRHYYKSIAKCAGKDYRDGAVVPFE